MSRGFFFGGFLKAAWRLDIICEGPGYPLFGETKATTLKGLWLDELVLT